MMRASPVGIVRAAALAALIGGALGATAHAQTVAPAATPDPTAQQIQDWVKADAVPVETLGAPDLPVVDAPAPRQVHGEAGVNYGSNGSYGGFVHSTLPLGQASALDLGYADEHLGNPGGGRGGGSGEVRALDIGLFVDGRDLQHLVRGAPCEAPHWGIALKGDPVRRADGTCVKAASGPGDKPAGGRRGRRPAPAQTGLAPADPQPVAPIG